MKGFKLKVPAVFYGRTARNIYFWSFLLLKKGTTTKTDLPTDIYLSLYLFNILFFIIPCTLNNYVLIPYLLRRKRYFFHVITCFTMIFGFSFVYTFWMKYLLVRFPGITLFDVSITMPLLTDKLTTASVLREMPTVFYLMLLIVFSFTGMWYINDYARNEKRVEEATKKQLETELNFLKSQINPHFLFNTLNNLYGLTLKGSSEAPEAILKLSSILRYILYESNPETVSFEKEKEIMQAYIDIELLRLPENGNTQFSILSDRTQNIPPLLWLPVLENVFKHGAHTLNDTYMIDFRYALHENTLSIYSKNVVNTSAIRTDPAKVGGIGLSNLRKRLEILYPGKYSISAGADSDNFYIVNVHIQLHD